MPMTNIKERLTSLYNLREKLCDKQRKEMQLEEIKDWVTDQLKYLKKIDINLIQGYLFSKPMPGSEIESFTKEFNAKYN